MKHILIFAALLPVTLFAASLPELPTVIYGSVFNQCGGRDVLVTRGELTWSLYSPDRPVRTVSGKLGNLANGAYSYRMTLPHEIKVDGKKLSDEAFELAKEPRAVEFIQPTLDGTPVHVINSENARMAFSTRNRARAVRIDLRVQEAMPDSDGDGLPDWWENAYSLDPDAPGDADADTDGDGWDNSREFEMGTSPTTDNRVPSLRISKFTVYPRARNGLWLECLDADTPPDEIAVTLAQSPHNGTLTVGDKQWSAGEAVSLQSLHESGLYYRGAGANTDEFDIALSDPDHENVLANVQLIAYEQDEALTSISFDTLERVLDYCQSHRLSPREGAALYAGKVWDFSQRKRPFTAEAPLGGWIIGSHFDDDIIASSNDDVLFPMGGDDTLEGGDGRDVFVPGPSQTEHDTILDFDPDADAVDLRASLRYARLPLEDLVTLAPGNGSTDIRVGPDADRRFALSLPGVSAFGTLGEAITAGRLLVPDAMMPACIQIAVLEDAQETGEETGSFRVWRTGSIANSQTVKIRVSGSATPGVDYVELPSTLTLPAGEREAVLTVSPIRDLQVEGDELVICTIEDRGGYHLGSASTADLRLTDLDESFALEVVEQVTVRDQDTPALVMVNRSGQIARQTLVELEYKGTAVNGTHVKRLPRYLEFAPHETRKPLEITPAADAEFSTTLSLRINLVPDNRITLGKPATVDVFLCPDDARAEIWRQILAAEAADPDGDGIPSAEEEKQGSDPHCPTLQIQKGWNLVSVPCTPSEEATLADQIGADLAENFVTAWAWNGSQYIAHSGPLIPGEGYFIYSLASGRADIAGEAVEQSIEVEPGEWNLLGASNRIRPQAIPEEWVAYVFVDGKYKPANETGLHRCQGFWLYKTKTENQ